MPAGGQVVAQLATSTEGGSSLLSRDAAADPADMQRIARRQQSFQEQVAVVLAARAVAGADAPDCAIRSKSTVSRGADSRRRSCPAGRPRGTESRASASRCQRSRRRPRNAATAGSRRCACSQCSRTTASGIGSARKRRRRRLPATHRSASSQTIQASGVARRQRRRRSRPAVHAGARPIAAGVAWRAKPLPGRFETIQQLR